ncbi:xyloglucan galactosyltransferase MUR3-like [Amaranthus tricolor]|uniref:xyloglucan galactosyltransferase MUR3-like n=1 Tax=Amaranthus tricolor TaxID=29722 RepID=UPI0025832108|nr:xyloglucan galactosyltransferase MUR3-like [Amaranthus tricolor]
MRRRWTVGAIPCQMEKGNSKNHNSRLCVLSSLCILFWSLLLYFHFVVLGSNNVHESTALQSNPIRIEIFNPVKTHLPVLNDVKSTSDAMTVLVHNDLDLSRNGVENEVKPEILNDVKSTNVPLKVRSDSELSQNDVENEGSGEVRLGGTSVSSRKIDVGSKSSDPKSVLPTQDEPQEFPFMRALRTVENSSDPCGGKYIYVHDLPSRFNGDMLKECRSLSLWTNMCKFTTNAGLGPPLENVAGVFSNTGWYATNQFAVDVIFNNRMKQYECLTNDSSIAAAIFVPFYAGFDIARYLWGYNISRRDAASLDLTDWLMKRPEWKIMDGRDHFLVAGRITWDFRRLTEEENDWGSKLLFLPAAKNMSMLVVESSPWNANDFAIPYPTYFHPAKDNDVFAWQDRMRKLERKYLFSFAGAPRPDNPKSIRGQIINQCKSTDTCKLLECDFGESKCHSPSSIMKMFQSSLFCLQPQGDSYTRRSAFDSMLAGCIPVFFHPGSAYTQYTWHLPKNYSSYSVFISENDVRKRNLSIEDTLRGIPSQQVEIMRETVINLIPKLIYADPRSKLETLPDAFDVSVQAVIDKVTRLRKNIIQGRTEYDNFIEENSWKYALLEDGQREVGYHEWDPFFSKPKEGEGDSNGASSEAAKNSWKNEQRSQSRKS